MNLKQLIPDYLINKTNTIIQIAFTTLFAYVFIIIYRPFGANEWYKINEWQFLLFTGAVVLTGMVVIILIRLLMFYLKKNHEITLALFIWMIVAEVLLMGVFFISFEKIFLDDNRSTVQLFLNSVLNTALILLIPYLMSSLFFAWTDIRKKLEHVIYQFRDPSEIFVPFRDESKKVKITLKLINILYLESNDNYVMIHYLDGEKTKSTIIRNTLKNLDVELKAYPIYRCHRKYAVNIRNVKLFRKAKKNFEVIINNEKQTALPVSKSYEQIIMKNLSIKI